MKNNKEKIKISEIEIKQISDSHKEIISKFVSYEKELVDFLVEDALDNQKKQMSITYLWFLKPTKELVAYVTVLADAISLQGELKEHFRQQGILYKSLPALNIKIPLMFHKWFTYSRILHGIWMAQKSKIFGILKMPCIFPMLKNYPQISGIL